MKNVQFLLLRFFCLFGFVCSFAFLFIMFPASRNGFSSLRAFSHLSKLQVEGARVPGSAAHAYSINYNIGQLQNHGWKVEIQTGVVNGHDYQNILARRDSSPLKILIGSHYDSRLVADRDPDPRFRTYPVPGVNDGGSSTAILLELARIIPPCHSEGLGFVFFDIEDQGNIAGWDWIMGSREFVRINPEMPEMMILVDMVGGHIQTIQPPENSDPLIYKGIQSVAQKLGYSESFLDPSKRGIIDDHVPFYEAGTLSVDLIDIIDPKWHTTSDDLENVSLSSLQKSVETLFVWFLTP